MIASALSAPCEPASDPFGMRRADDAPAGWAVSTPLVPYPEALAAMEARAIVAGEAGELVWLLEHPPLYTAGVSAKPADLLAPGRFPVHATSRGGRYTYHGPGQRVAYVMLELRARRRDVGAFVRALEGWLIAALERFDVKAELRPGRVGVWVARTREGCPGRADKIAAVGVKLRRWVSFHGVSLNVAPDLDHFAGIVPCGITAHGVTSLVDLGRPAGMGEVDDALKTSFARVFGPLRDCAPPV